MVREFRYLRVLFTSFSDSLKVANWIYLNDLERVKTMDDRYSYIYLIYQFLDFEFLI